MPFVRAQQVQRLVLERQDDDGGVGEADAEIGVPIHQPTGAGDVGMIEGRDSTAAQ